MAYAQYQDASGMLPPRNGGFVGPGRLRPAMPPDLTGAPSLGPEGGMPFGQLNPGQPQGGVGPGPLPTNTRQTNLQNVQQAYAAPRAPGDMGYLNQMLQQSSSPVSATDPNIAPAFAAGRLADTRNIDRQRAALAEQLGGVGLGASGAMRTKLGGIQQRVGENQALRESGMLYDESNARRNALLQGLGLDQSRYGTDTNAGLDIARLQALLNQQAVQPFL